MSLITITKECNCHATLQRTRPRTIHHGAVPARGLHIHKRRRNPQGSKRRLASGRYAPIPAQPIQNRKHYAVRNRANPRHADCQCGFLLV